MWFREKIDFFFLIHLDAEIALFPCFAYFNANKLASLVCFHVSLMRTNREA